MELEYKKKKNYYLKWKYFNLSTSYSFYPSYSCFIVSCSTSFYYFILHLHLQVVQPYFLFFFILHFHLLLCSLFSFLMIFFLFSSLVCLFVFVSISYKFFIVLLVYTCCVCSLEFTSCALHNSALAYYSLSIPKYFPPLTLEFNKITSYYHTIM